ncbi:MAG: hypothetical protein OSA99_05605 [Acidimicrobiales bacterium]|nr:hypothetical protein [Acidimicrobiales bacterium]
MEFSVEVPLDADGFVRRECPNCEREFKWFDGATEESPPDWEDPDSYFCPYCGQQAGGDEWWTQAQLNYAEQVALIYAGQAVTDELTGMARTINRQGGLIRLEVSGESESPLPPPLQEPNDMVAVAAPCHLFEPIKVIDDLVEPLHCLICGNPFEV